MSIKKKLFKKIRVYFVVFTELRLVFLTLCPTIFSTSYSSSTTGVTSTKELIVISYFVVEKKTKNCVEQKKKKKWASTDPFFMASLARTFKTALRYFVKQYSFCLLSFLSRVGVTILSKIQAFQHQDLNYLNLN